MSTEFKIWLDDTRQPPDNTWAWCHWPTTAINCLRSGKVTHISLDHDLGDVYNPHKERTGYDVLVWLEEQVATGAWPFSLPKIGIHTDNSCARRKMLSAVERIERFYREDQEALDKFHRSVKAMQHIPEEDRIICSVYGVPHVRIRSAEE